MKNVFVNRVGSGRKSLFSHIISGVALLLFLIVQSSAQTARNTDRSPDQSLRSNARVNPSTLALEFSIPLGGFQGRAGNGLPFALNYSSKVWQINNTYSWIGLTRSMTDNQPRFARHSAAGWTTTLGAPRIDAKIDIYCETGDNGSGQPWSPPPHFGEEDPVQCNKQYVKRLRVEMPDGAAHEFRQDDGYHAYGTANPELTGTFLSTDGTRMRMEMSETPKTLYLPDGSRYQFGTYGTFSELIADTFIDRHGNRMTYSYANKEWTDTLGRTLKNLLPIERSFNMQPSVGTQIVTFPGLTGASAAQSYELKWESLDTQVAALAYTSNITCNGSLSPTIPNGADHLFSTESADRVCGGGAPFNGTVLTEIKLPNGAKYKFTHNKFGEVVRIDYPSGGYERFEYRYIEPVASTKRMVYDQSNRGVWKRWLSYDGTSGSEVQWIYEVERVTTPAVKYTVKTYAPDGTRSEQDLHDEYSDQAAAYGYDDLKIGRAYESRTYSSNNQLMSRKLTKWTPTGALTIGTVTGYSQASRDLRVEKEISIIFDPGNTNALVQMSETIYETPGQNNAPTDPAYFAAQNARESKIYKYKVLTAATAQTASIDTLANLFSSSDAEVVTETDYLYDANYKARNITGLATETRIRDAANNIKAKSQISYDESSYLEAANITGAPGWTNPNTSYRGLPTTTKSWSDIANNQFVETHAAYDQFGNPKKSWDGRGNYSEISYADNYTDNTNRSSYALPTETKSYSGASGTGTVFTTSIKYDFNTGFPIKTTDPNGLETRMEYADALLRPTKVSVYNGSNQQVGAATITEYGAPDSSGQLPAAQRFTKVKTQIDETKWKEGYSWFDGLGRAIKSQSVDSNGDVFALTCYDQDGRVSKVSNPFRNVSNPTCSSSLEWTTNTYDAAGRVWKVTTPDNAVVETNYSLATSGSNIGTVVTVKDQALKERRSVTNALGQLTRVDEPDVSNSNSLGTVDAPHQPTYYEYDTLNNLTKVKQGGMVTNPTQTRSFVYDSLSRLKSANNPESGTINYVYDNNGNLTKKTDARLVETNYVYDALNRVTQRNYAAPANLPNYQATPAVIYTYDNLPNAKGKLTKVTNGFLSGGTITNPFSVTEYQAFDQMGRITQSQQTTDGTAYGVPMTYTYNLSGALIEQKYPSGRVVKNVLDNDGDLSIVQSKKNQTSGYWNYADNFTYTAAGAVTSMQLGNGRWESTSFNSRLQPTQIALGTVQNGTDKLNLNFSYNTTGQNDNNGNVLSQTITVPTEVRGGTTHNGFTATQTYTYDSLNRIKQASELITGQTPVNWQQTFQYDRYGNRTFDEANTTVSINFPKACGGSMCAADKKIYNPQAQTADNKFSTSDGYLYDNSGNTTRNAENRKFTYDAENKQTKVETVDVSGNPINTLGEYFYDGDGKRVKKIAGTEVTIFIYDAAGKLVAEYANQIAQTPTVSYLTSDHLGSPRINTDANGAVIARHDYQPFGEEIARASYGVDDVREQFATYERDKETDLDFAQARYFNPNFGRFSSPDDFLNDTHKQSPASWNLYVYVQNNPLKFIDPNGEEIWIYVNGDLGGERLQYKNGKLYTRDGEEYEGDDDYALRVLNDLNQLIKDDDYVGYMINTLESSDKIHDIYWNRNSPIGSSEPNNIVKAKNGEETGSLISYNPYNDNVPSGKVIKGGADLEKGPARINLAHEMWHSFDTDQGRFASGQRRILSPGQKQTEIDAVRFENRVRAVTGVPRREKYSFPIPPEYLEPSTPINNTDANKLNVSLDNWKRQMSGKP